MKHSFLTLMVLLMAICPGFTQNLDKNKERVSYTRLPATPLPEEISQYHVNIDLGYIYSGDSKTETLNKIKNAAVLGHLEKTENEGVELLVRLETYYKGEVKYETETKKEKRDDKEVTVTYYYLTFDYKYPLYYEVKLPGEMDPLRSGFVNNSDQMTSYTSGAFKSSSARSKWWSDNYKSVQGKLRTELLNKNVGTLRANLDNSFSYSPGTIYTEFITVKKFKKFEYGDLDEAYEHVKKALAEISENDIVFNDAFTTEMKAAIAIWDKALEESDLDNRKVRINKKVTEAIYNNLYLAYGIMSDFETADKVKEHAEELLGRKAIDNYFERFISARKERFEANEGRIPESI